MIDVELIIRSIERLCKVATSTAVDIAERTLSLKELDERDCRFVLECDDPIDLELLRLCALYLKLRTSGTYVTFVCNRNINFTNICVIGCNFCNYSVPPGHPSGYVLSLKEVERKVRESVRHRVTEVCLQGGVNPELKLDYYISLLRTVKKVDDKIHVHAFSPQEIYSLSRRESLNIDEILKVLRENGLDTLPGTAAEILCDDVRKIICPRKIKTAEWVGIIERAHMLGIKTTCTIMYGHIERIEHVVRHFRILRDIQRRTRGFTEIVLLPFIHYNTRLREISGCRSGSSSLYDIRICIAARLYLYPYITNIQVSWVKLGRKLAQYLLTCGANDIGGTLMEENISHAAGAFERESMSREELIDLISSIGMVPAERDTLYNIVRVYQSGNKSSALSGTTGSSLVEYYQ
ncbi:MAG: 5-amino-6-(D-ribitylamino)uracil--L-tyrosine 4-hydroxyphenyl transferase CofH [Crenarchaeota archaeon]|nr:5-amino-6-(D-ribitylamino)uracil--L-tyrosine 4-hydroxyphenyl transferase CofH [Thermoproteota archaeon]